MVGLNHFLILGAAMFAIGLTGALTKRNVITVAAAEVALGLALVIAIHKDRDTVDVTAVSGMKG